MHRKKRWIFLLTFCLATCAVGFLSASLATDNWVKATPTRKVDEDTEDGARNVTDVECIEEENLCGWVWGSYSQLRQEAELLAAISTYQQRLAEAQSNNVTDSVEDHGLFNFGLWVSSIIFVALGIIWGLVSMGFAALNAGTRPIETITGPMGLYLWNSLAALFSLTAIIVYVVLYYMDLKQNVLTEEDRIDLWTSENRTTLHYSFYFVVVATILYAVNLLIVAFGGIQCTTVKYGRNMNDKAMDGVMMY